VYIEWLEATVLPIYIPKEKWAFICTSDLPCSPRPPGRLAAWGNLAI
jgi:hypothetical protein